MDAQPVQPDQPASLPALGADVPWPDAAAAAAAEAAGGHGAGRLGGLAQWIAGAQGSAVPTPPRSPRAVLLDAARSSVAAASAGRLGVDTVEVAVPDGVAAATAYGATMADRAADEGCELLVVAGPSDPAAAAIISLIARAEPVALLPRGAAAVDTSAWIDAASQLRDILRSVSRLREDPDALLAALGSPALACAAGMTMRAAARRTAVVADGPLAAAAAVLCQDVQARSGQWVRCADTHPDPVHQRAVEDLAHPPVLDVGLDRGDGLAGVLAVGLILTAVELNADG